MAAGFAFSERICCARIAAGEAAQASLVGACSGRHAVVQTGAELAPASLAEQACRHISYARELPSQTT
jgi:hypothetical protein